MRATTIWIRSAAALLGLLLTACATDIEPGKFLCQADQPGSCPSGWICQCRGTGCDWLCYQSAAGYCGDGELSAGEECDRTAFVDPNACDGDGFPVCRTDCTVACTVCGNGVLEATPSGEREECDDHNRVDGDGCSATCTLARCGDGVEDVTLHEGCDEGAANSDEPDATCRTSCQPRRCGDGITDRGAGEVCDDGNLSALDGCTPDCKSVESCGNGYVDFLKGELCDDGNFVNHDGCSSACKAERLTWIPVEPSAPGAVDAAYYDTWRGKTTMVFGDTRSAHLGLWDWDGTRWTKHAVTSGPPPLKSFAITFDSHRGRAVLFGGDSFGPAFSDTWEWDGASWTRHVGTPQGPAGRRMMGLTYDARHREAVLFGGMTDQDITNDTWLWNGTWRRATPTTSPPTRYFHSMAYDPARDRVVVFGGLETFDSEGGLADTWEWDGSTWLERHPAHAPPGRYAATLTYDADLRGVVLIGGAADAQTDRDDVWLWNGEDWAPLPRSQPARARHGAAYDFARRRLVLFGGYGPADGRVWELAGDAWTPVAPSAPMPTMYDASLAYDSMRSRAVLFAGQQPGSSTETWEWDGSGWTVMAPAHAPTYRDDPSIAYDPIRRRVLLFGGDPRTSSRERLADTWEWNGVDWERKVPATSPPGRYGASLAFDTRRARAVLFGGSAVLSDLDDTWEWDGVTWTRSSPPLAPSSRLYASMSYDPVDGRCLLIGGGHSAGLRGDADSDFWDWDGRVWTSRQLPAQPWASQSFLAFDPSRGRTVAMGGWLYSNGWTWDGTAWRQDVPPGPFAPGTGFVYDTRRQEFLLVDSTGTWRLRYTSESPDETCAFGVDADGDGLLGCADGDCWSYCAPLCGPAVSCDPSWPHCGDGACDPNETCRICPGDCGACVGVCGDALCDPDERADTCPGDCAST